MEKKLKVITIIILKTTIDLLILEQDYIGIPASPCFQLHVPKSTLDYLHPISKKRFAKISSSFISVENMSYDPYDKMSAFLV